MSDETNKYKAGTPEWQLLENAISADRAARAFDADAERFRAKSEEQRIRAEAYRAALSKVVA
jgi:hypothetical protein